MKHRVSRKQPNSRMCMVCGLQNPHGLAAAFFELENGEVAGLVTARAEHQSYPGRMHGGVVTALLDEAVGRAIMTSARGDIWAVTAEFKTRFLKPIPLDTELRVVGRVVKEDGRRYEGTGEILLPDGQVAATGAGRYVQLPIERIADFDVDHQQWKVTPMPTDPHAIDLP